MSESDNSDNFGGKSVDSEENDNNNLNNNTKKDENEIKDESQKKNENDKANIKKEQQNSLTDERKVINLNNGNYISSLQINRKKDVILIEIDEEKTNRNKYTVYQLIELKNNSNFNMNDIDSKNQNNEKSILCYRRYSDFDKFYNVLKLRYPHCIFPRLSLKGFKFNEDKIF